MVKSDDENLLLSVSTESVDNLNAQFYGKFPYPWRPAKFEQVIDPYFETIMLNQNIGDWQHRTIDNKPMIWVAGCGTNQAVYTALKFPNATVLGSDLSAESLQLCSKTADSLGISNLQLKQESINQVEYKDLFDYIICTGVIHHNANPEATLGKLATALKSNGILELMVYNRFHRIINSSFQKAVRIFNESIVSSVDFDSEFLLAKKIVASGFLAKNLMSSFLQRYKDVSKAEFADELIQPVEHSYTLESLEELATNCGLEIVAPCLNPIDGYKNTLYWNMEFNDCELQEIYNSLPNLYRWKISNILMFESSPMLWFYIQRKSSNNNIKSEAEICDAFLKQRFILNSSKQRNYILKNNDKYELSSKEINFPYPPSDKLLRKILELVDPETPMSEIFQKLDIETKFSVVNKLRLQLTTSMFPYLTAIN